MNSHSRVLPISKYRDPNYDSDSSFENYYLNYSEEKNPAPVIRDHIIDQTVVDDDDHNKEMFTKTHDHHRHRRIIRSVRSSNRRINQTRLSLMTATPDNSSARDDHDGPMVENDQAVGPVLFIRRVLQKIDVSEQQHRLSMPCKQVKLDPKRFFTREERARLRNKLLVKAKLVDPRGKEFKINLKMLESGATSYCYAIGKPWLIIKDENGFKSGMVLDVRVERRRGGELCFTLHIVV
ncbi:hypothetical protein CASFOL_020744 [Castilleja foliolosa]|uniref:TF-B3 domain-containing protein n=1 Tax=Castilleja foliolosa TaxID=1961234 RepID=A0ABD3D617_9LAMI